ncbi:hypothetical protein GE09DRAFT_227349 [Coniochaeta sp. 2T2.1]|nr:hypothetical protein GE09DRAFT_227349 [Coniochaeta sp. 2T2.1]
MAFPRSSVSLPVPEGPRAELVCDSPKLNANLVHASPVLHQQYLLDRMTLLCKFLKTTLRSVTIDAFSVYQSGLTDFSRHGKS